MENTGLCKKCKSGKNLSEGLCLTELYLNITVPANIATAALLTECE